MSGVEAEGHRTGPVAGPAGVLRLVPAHAFFVVSAVFHYLGPAFAVLLFARVEPLGVAWLRITTAAVAFAMWRRPWRRWSSADRGTRRLLLTWGLVLATMNASFYLALDRMPLGTVAAIEFLPVIVLAAAAVRTGRNLLAVLAAVLGVALLSDVHLAGAPLGLAFAALNAGLFAVYVVLAHRAARNTSLSGIDGLALAMIIAAVVALPVGIGQALPAFGDARLLAAAAGVGICSSVIPYVCDQLAMSRLARSTYALMSALMPATATVVGALVLTQIPSPVEIVGVLLVMLAVAVHKERDRSAPTTGPGRHAPSRLGPLGPRG